MARMQLLLGLLIVFAWHSGADNASIRWVELDGYRTTVINLAFGSGIFYIMNINNMSNIAIEDGMTRVMNEGDYRNVRGQFGDFPSSRSLMALGNDHHKRHADHDRWYRKALKRYNAQKARMEFHMHDELWK